jgi:uncharacterized ferritin-like protein (DUF455 family)
MEMRDLAERIVTSTRLADKVAPAPDGPAALTDRRPGPPLRRSAPGRPPDLEIVPVSRAKVPSIEGMPDPAQRARILHAFANHELQAAELFAWALLAFPDAPAPFRRGLAAILDDEQRHTRMYIARCEAHGLRFGAQPVSGYFWSKVEHIDSPAAFVCAMSLTFENANLDHTVDYAAAARAAGDEQTAAVIDRVHRDEIEHVRFGWTWLERFKPEGQTMWDAFRSNLTWPLRPLKAKGTVFHPEGRVAAGLDPEFVRLLEAAEGAPPDRRRG